MALYFRSRVKSTSARCEVQSPTGRMKGNSLWCAVDRRQEVDYMALSLALINWTSHWATFELYVKYVEFLDFLA